MKLASSTYVASNLPTLHVQGDADTADVLRPITPIINDLNRPTTPGINDRIRQRRSTVLSLLDDGNMEDKDTVFHTSEYGKFDHSDEITTSYTDFTARVHTLVLPFDEKVPSPSMAWMQLLDANVDFGGLWYLAGIVSAGLLTETDDGSIRVMSKGSHKADSKPYSIRSRNTKKQLEDKSAMANLAPMPKNLHTICRHFQHTPKGKLVDPTQQLPNTTVDAFTQYWLLMVCAVSSCEEEDREKYFENRRNVVRCAFSDRNAHSRMPLDPIHVRLKRTYV
jgi:hypothetical protein